MKKISIFLVMGAIFLCGCTAWHQLRDDYLQIGQKEEESFGDSMQSFKYDYLNADRPIMTEERKTEVIQIAQKILLDNPQKNNYQIDAPELDENIRMPEAYGYVFIHFPPVTTNPKITATTFLIVLQRFNNRVLYADIFTQPKGDPFYRYNGILRMIKEH